MAKKDETTVIEARASSQEGTALEESVAAIAELTHSVIGRSLQALGALSVERAKIVGRGIDFAEALGQSAIKLARDVADAETAIERQALVTVDRVLGTWVRWGSGSALAVASAAGLKPNGLPAREEPARAQA